MNDGKDWAWCPHCYRCYQVEEAKRNEQGQRCCPYDDCHYTIRTVCYWETYKIGRGNMPAVPTRGAVYGLYDNFTDD